MLWRRLMLLVLFLVMALAVVWMLNQQAGEPAAVSNATDVAMTLPAEQRSVAEPSSSEPLEPATIDREALVLAEPSPPSMPADDGTHTLYGEVLDAVSLTPVTMFRMACLPLGEDIERAAEKPPTLRTFSNPIGTFTWRKLQPGTYNLLIRIDGYEQLIVRAVTVPTNVEKLSYRLSRGAYVDVAVTDFEGDGISDLEVRLNPVALDDPTKGGPRVRLRFTDNYGKTGFTNLPSGTYSVSLNSVGLTHHLSETFYLGVGANFPVNFQVPLLNTVRVHAEDTKGNLLGTVQVRMWRQEGQGVFRAETDRDGTASIDHVPQGEYLVKLYKHGFRRKNQTLTVSSESSDVPLKIVMLEDPEALERELHPTPEQLQRLKLGERPSEVFLDESAKGGN